MAINWENRTCDLIADLRTFDGAPNIQSKFQTLGGTALNDGSGGIYSWNATSTTAVDGFNFIEGKSGTGAPGRWHRIVSNGITLSSDKRFRRVGNILYDAVDPYTNEPATWTKAIRRPDGLFITDSIVDDVLFLKFNGEYFIRNSPCSINGRWYGMVADYEATTDVGTANDVAFQLMMNNVAYFSQWTYQNSPPNAWKSGIPTIYLPRGNYLFTSPNKKWNTGFANKGTRFIGDGKYSTNLYFKCSEADNGTSNYMFDNSNYARDVLFEHMRITGVSGTERFMNYRTIGSSGIASSMSFTEVAFDGNMKLWFDVTGTVNCSENRFMNCTFKDLRAGQTFISLANGQSVNWSFVTCDAENIAGTFLDVTKGGAINWYNGSIVTIDSGTFIKLTDTTGTGIGANNGMFKFTGIKTEIRNTSKLLNMNAHAGLVIFDNCFAEVNNAAFASRGTWATATAYAVGDTVNIGGVRGRAYQCSVAHTSDATTVPGTGASWTTVWAPLYEVDVTAGQVRYFGGKSSAQIALRWALNDYTGIGAKLMVDGTYIDRQPYDLVDIINTGNSSFTGSSPKASFVNIITAGGVNNPFDVTLGLTTGYSFITAAIRMHIYRAGLAATAGLPVASSPGTFMLPRGATVLEVGIVSEAGTLTNTYTISSAGTVLLSGSNFDVLTQVTNFYKIDTEVKRTITFTNTGSVALQGFMYVKYF